MISFHSLFLPSGHAFQVEPGVFDKLVQWLKCDSVSGKQILPIGLKFLLHRSDTGVVPLKCISVHPRASLSYQFTLFLPPSRLTYYHCARISQWLRESRVAALNMKGRSL